MLTNFPVNVKAPAAAAVLGESGLIHGYIRYAVGTRSFRELAQLWWSIVRFRPQVLVYLGPMRGVPAAQRDATFFRFCGIFRQIGVPLTEEMQKHAFQPKTAALEPECERLARNIAELGDAMVESPHAWDLRLTEIETDHAARFLAPANGRPILAVSMGTKVQSKDWGQENWQNLLARLAQSYSRYALLLTGVLEERAASEFAADGWRAVAGDTACVINLCGVLTPRETAACFRHARVFLGHDSGPMHLAATVGTPCVAIFAARNLPRVWFPYGPNHRVLYHPVDCMGCGLETCIEQRKKCLTSITVDEVASAVEAVLSDSKSAPAGLVS
jgi:ADP-heptose:LPS heptosyltransferase